MRYARTMGWLLSLGLWSTLATGADGPVKRPSFEVELIFERIDLSGDGAIDRAEFLQFSDYAPRLRGKPEAANQAFDRLDANKDGLVSKEEYVPAASAQIAARSEAGKPRRPMPMPAPAPTGERPVGEGPITPEQLSFFEAKIRPVLIENCYKCHAASSDKIKANFVLDTRRESAKGGTWVSRWCRATSRRAC